MMKYAMINFPEFRKNKITHTDKVHAAAAAKSLLSCPTLCDPIDGSPPGSPVPGILQARTLEWVAKAKLSTKQMMLLNCGVGEDS